MKNSKIKNSGDFLFLRGEINIANEVEFQNKLNSLVDQLGGVFRKMMKKPAFSDLNRVIEKHGSMLRYTIHPYSFRKSAFTRIADTLGEMAAHAITGHKAYLDTYYKKSKEERAEDYRKLIPGLSVFGVDAKSKLDEEYEEATKSIKDNDTKAAVLEFLKNSNMVARR